MSIRFITLACPSCGARLKVEETAERLACEYCGNEHIVSRTGEDILLEPMVERLHEIASGFDRHASELAILRLKKEIAELEPRRQKRLAELERRQEQALAQIELKRQMPPESEIVNRLQGELAKLEQKRKSFDVRWQAKVISQIGARSVAGVLLGCLTSYALDFVIFIIIVLAVRLVRDLVEVTTSTTINLAGREDVFWILFGFSTVVTLPIVTLLVFRYARNAVRKQRLIMQEISSKREQIAEEISRLRSAIEQEAKNAIHTLEEEISRSRLEVDRAISAERLVIEQELADKQEQPAKHYGRVSI